MLINLDRTENYLILSQVQFRQIDAHKKLINFTWFSALISISITKTKLKETKKRKKINKIACEIQFLFTRCAVFPYLRWASLSNFVYRIMKKKSSKIGRGIHIVDEASFPAAYAIEKSLVSCGRDIP